MDRLAAAGLQKTPAIDGTSPLQTVTPPAPAIRDTSLSHHDHGLHTPNTEPAYEARGFPSIRGSNSFAVRGSFYFTSIWHRLPEAVVTALKGADANYPISYEVSREPLILSVGPQGKSPISLSALNVSVVRDLSLACFATFNLLYPILDRDLYLRHTFPAAITNDFGNSVETCVVLAAMALGCWGKAALKEAGMQEQSDSDRPDLASQFSGSSDIPGLALFTEAKQRMASLLGDKSLQSAQCHLLLR